MRILCLAAIIMFATNAQSHGGQPMAQAIVFQDSHPGVQWVLTDNQGIYANLKSGFRWLCEDAIAPNAGVRGLLIRGTEGTFWTVATSQGLFGSTDGGCGFARIQGPMNDRPLAGLWTVDDRWWTGSADVDGANDVFFSDDEGQTWQAMGLALDGRVIALLPSIDRNVLYLHTSTSLWVSRNGGARFSRLMMTSADRTVPGNQLLEIKVSPTAAGTILATVDAGTRTRMLRSMDGGATWSDVALFSQPRIRFIIASDGQRVLAVSHLGLSWRSEDAGVTWNEANQIARGMDCLRHDPDGLRIWACGDIYNGAAWVTAHSDDFGLSFTPSLTRYETSSERWDCEARDNATRCCRGLCPGELMSIDCGQPQAGELPPQCSPAPPMDIQPVEIDMGMALDAESLLETDVGGDADSGHRIDVGQNQSVHASQSCQSVTVHTSSWILALIVLGLCGTRRDGVS